MKSSAASTLIVALVLGAAAFLLGRLTSTPGGDSVLVPASQLQAGNTANNLAWMRKELSLSEEEFTRFCALHDAYMAECRRMSAEMDKTRARLKSTLQNRHEFDDVALAALSEYEKQYDICERAATKHLMKAAAAMDAESGRAYLKLMLPRIFPDHDVVMQAAALTRRDSP